MANRSTQRLEQAIADHVAGRIDAAEAGYRGVLKLDPQEPSALLWLGLILNQRGAFEEAEACLSRSLRRAPRNAVAHINHGFALAGLGKTEAAIAAYRRAIAIDPTQIDAHNNLGVVLEQIGRPAEAAEAFQSAVDLNPESAATVANLGNALQFSGQLEAAIAQYRRSLTLDAQASAVWNNLGHALFRLNRLAEACDAYRQGLAVEPGATQLRQNLARTLHEARRLDEARDEYQAVITLDPSNVDAHVSLGLLFYQAGMNAEARDSYARGLAIDPGSTSIRLSYASCLEELGDHDGARRERRAALAHQRTAVEPCIGAQKRAEILLLSTSGFGNIPIDFLVDLRVYGRTRLYLEDLPPEGIGPPPAHDLIFNVIADPDSAASGLEGARAFLKTAERPVLNDPEKVMRTKRHLIPALLADIPLVHVPTTISRRRADLLAEGDSALAGAGAFPMLVRPAGSHGGEGLEVVDDRAALHAYLENIHDEDVFLTPYYDYRSADGLFRKYRILFVDRKIYPLHLCIDHKWKVHYYTSMMRDHAWMRAEEEAFLADIGAAFSPALQAAATAIAERLDLDYAGMDCAITPDGKLLVFEANANMLAHLNDPIEMFPYKHRYVPRVRDAFDAMVARLTAGG